MPVAVAVAWGAVAVAVAVARGAVAVAVPVAVAVGMAVAVALMVAPILLMPMVAMVPERAPLLAAIGDIVAHLAVGLPGVPPRLVASLGGGGTRNRAGRD